MTPITSTIYQTLSQEQTQTALFTYYGIPLLILAVVLIGAGIVMEMMGIEKKYFNTRIGSSSIIIGCLLFISLSAVGLLTKKTPLTFSPYQMLEPLWYTYKTTFIESTTNRTVDMSRQYISTSEGESYTMLRAVWRGDKETFDKSWTWAQANLQRQDYLFAWLYLPGTSTIRATSTLTAAHIAGRNNTASDADTTIALALIFAYARWQDDLYLDEARLIINSIWENETITIGDEVYVLANNLEKSGTGPTALINPSYLHPAAYRVFALVDTEHPWSRAIDGTYTLLNKASQSPLDTKVSAGLPPDWVRIHRITGEVSAPTTEGNTSQFGYDAIRVIWNVALDFQWSGDNRAKTYLESLSFLHDEWEKREALMATYTHSGAVTQNGAYETPAMYGATIAYFKVEHPDIAADIYRDKLEALFDSDSNTWRQQLSYYDDNIAWFGIALYNNLLPNLLDNYPIENLSRL